VVFGNAFNQTWTTWINFMIVKRFSSGTQISSGAQTRIEDKLIFWHVEPSRYAKNKDLKSVFRRKTSTTNPLLNL